MVSAAAAVSLVQLPTIPRIIHNNFTKPSCCQYKACRNCDSLFNDLCNNKGQTRRVRGGFWELGLKQSMLKESNLNKTNWFEISDAKHSGKHKL